MGLFEFPRADCCRPWRQPDARRSLRRVGGLPQVWEGGREGPLDLRYVRSTAGAKEAFLRNSHSGRGGGGHAKRLDGKISGELCLEELAQV